MGLVGSLAQTMLEDRAWNMVGSTTTRKTTPSNVLIVADNA
jgi:hypothetical protein